MKQIVNFLVVFLITLSVSQAQTRMAVAQLGDNWGITDKNGNWIVQPSFENAPTPFVNGIAIVKVDKKYGAVNLNGELILEPQYLKLSTFDKHGFAVAEVDLAFLTKNNLPPLEKAVVIINQKGEILGNKSFVKADNFKDGVAIVVDHEKNKYHINTQGEKLIIKYNNIEIQPLVFDFSEGLGSIKLENKVGYINNQGKVVIPPTYDIGKSFKQEQALVRLNENWGVIDKNGKLITELKYTKITELEDGYRTVIEKGKMGVINYFGEFIIPVDYDKITKIGKGNWLVEKGNKRAFLDKNGFYKEVPKDIDHIYRYKDGFAMAKNKKGNLGMIDVNGNWTVQPIYLVMDDLEGGMAKVIVEKGKPWRYVSTSGKEIVVDGAALKNNYGSFSEGVANVNINGKIGFIDTDGNMIIQPKYDPLVFKRRYMQFEKGISIVKYNGKFGCIDKSGNWIIEPIFNKIEPFFEVENESANQQTIDKNAISGYFKYRKLKSEQISGLKVYLVDDEGNILYTTTTNEKGYFIFTNLELDKNYLLKINENEDDFDLVLLSNIDNSTVAVLSNDMKGYFIYRELNYDQISGLSMLYTIDAEMVEGQFTKSLNGQFRYKTLSTEKIDGLKVFLIDNQGNVIYTTTTDKQGMFSFSSLPFDQNFLVQLEEPNGNLELFILNDKGIVANMNANEKGVFRFMKLPNMNVNSLITDNSIDDDDIYIDKSSVMAQFRYKYLKNNYLTGKTISINNAIGTIISAAKSDALGRIYFDGWNAGASISFEIHDNANDTNTVELSLYNFKGDLITRQVSKKGKTFSYSFLKSDLPENPAFLVYEDGEMIFNGKSFVDEGDVLVKKLSEEQYVIYFGFNSTDYDFNKDQFLKDLVIILSKNKALQVDITAFSDKVGKPEYNKELSVKRAESVAQFLISNQISQDRVSYRGMGSTNFAVDCNPCSEQEHQMNRRAVLKVN
jgi:outer membrane protein OmpA-like peptidoglycan-associated protein